jgi:RNA polymerase sigma-70 factor (ECF subfamily)
MTTTIEGLWDTHERHIFHYLNRMMGNVSEAEELTQETFLRAYRYMEAGKFKDERPKPWLFRIATNVALDELRRRKSIRFTRLDTAFTAVVAIQRGKSLSNALVLRFVDRANVEREAVDNEDATEMRAALESLPRRYRTALVLRYHEEMPLAEIAVVLGTTHGAVKSLLFRARAELRESLEALADNRAIRQPWSRRAQAVA